MADVVVVLGGIRSGKSAIAEQLVAGHERVAYVATAVVGDDEMRARVKAHQERRPAHWTTVETSNLAAAVTDAPHDAAIVIDGLGGWLAQRLDGLGAFAAGSEDARADASARVLDDVEDLVAAARGHGAPVVVVAEEVGMSLVAPDAGTRLWVDLLGTVVQRLSHAATRVLLVHAGRAIELPPPVAGHATTAPDHLREHGDTMVPAGAADFAVNVHGDRPPPHLEQALAAAFNDAHHYPDPTAATEALAARHQRDAREVLPTAGAAEAFWLLASAVSARRAVVVHPQFTEPEAALRSQGIPVTHVHRRESDGWALDPAAVPADAELVVVGAPNNPTGTLDDPGVLASLCRPGRVTVIDEAFIDFVAASDAGVAHRVDLPGLVVVRSVTKLWGLAGLRAGYLVGPAGLIARCGAARQPWAVSAPALRALEVCAGDEGYRSSVAADVAAWRDSLVAQLRALPDVTVWDSAANFVLVRVPDGPRVYRCLLQHGVAVRPSTFPGLGPDYLRVAVRPPPVASTFVEALNDVLAARSA